MEDVNISASGVTLIGTDLIRSFNVIKGNITINGAIGVELSNFTVDGTGGVGFEVAVQDGSFAVLTAMDLNTVHLTANRNAGMSLLDSTVLGAPGDQALQAFRNSLIRIENTIVTGANAPAVRLGGHSYLHAVNSTLIAGSDPIALAIFESSGARLQGGTVITGQVNIFQRSTVTSIDGLTINGNVNLFQGAALIGGIVDPNIVVNGVLTCIDSESSRLRVTATGGGELHRLWHPPDPAAPLVGVTWPCSCGDVESNIDVGAT